MMWGCTTTGNALHVNRCQCCGQALPQVVFYNWGCFNEPPPSRLSLAHDEPPAIDWADAKAVHRARCRQLHAWAIADDRRRPRPQPRAHAAARPRLTARPRKRRSATGARNWRRP